MRNQGPIQDSDIHLKKCVADAAPGIVYLSTRSSKAGIGSYVALTLFSLYDRKRGNSAATIFDLGYALLATYVAYYKQNKNIFFGALLAKAGVNFLLAARALPSEINTMLPTQTSPKQ